MRTDTCLLATCFKTVRAGSHLLLHQSWLELGRSVETFKRVFRVVDGLRHAFIYIKGSGGRDVDGERGDMPKQTILT